LRGVGGLRHTLLVPEENISNGQEEYVYASAIYTDGTVDAAIVDGPLYNDVVAIHTLTLQPAYHGQQLEVRIVRKIADVIGYHCAAVVFDPEQVGLSETDELGIHLTKNSSLFCLPDF
jgi:hypothetical protein